MADLTGKRVLYLAPKFFGYDQDILEELQSRGATVDVLRDRPFDSPTMMALTRFARASVMSAVDRHYTTELERFGRSAYDLVFVVNGQTLSTSLLRRLRASYPAAEFILYMWDSITNRPSVLSNLPFFDRVFTFDRKDAGTYGFRFRPLFFSRGFEAPSDAASQYHISFIGTAHTDRAKIVSVIDRSLPLEVKRFWYLYLQAPWVFAINKVTNPSFRSARLNQFCFDPLPKKRVQTVLALSRAILDIEHPRQIGLTIRTFETLGAGKKLITTNSEVASYDFFNPSNICVVDRKNAVIPQKFLEDDFVPISPALRRKYSLVGWLDEILTIS